jgi:ribonucleoside-diphosphate reductase beta chain
MQGTTEDRRTFTLGDRTFVLDAAKAEAALAAKRVVGGRATHAFNLLPLRYGWAYELYRSMKANHWEPEDVPLQRDAAQWRSHDQLSDVERWIVRMGIGYFSAAEGIVGDNIIHVVRELVTASELKLVLGRHAHEENIHADSLLYMISSLGIDPHECEAMFADVPTIARKNEFVGRVSAELRRDLDMRSPEHLRLLARNIFVFGQCMEGTQFYGLFGMILSLYRQGKLTGVGTMFRYTLRDESNHIEVFRRLLLELVAENPGIWTPELRSELRELMREAVELEREFIRDCLPVHAVGLSATEFEGYIDFIADRRLVGVGLEPLSPGAVNPLPWLAELMDVRKEQNFFEGRVTEYQRASALSVAADDEL